MQKRRILPVLLLASLLLVFWAGIELLTTGETVRGDFSITAFSVGKADALLVRQGAFAALVDTGEKEDGPRLLEALEDRGVSSLDLLIVTHFDKDHVGGAAQIVEAFDPEQVLLPDYEGEREEYQELLEALAGRPKVQRVSEPLSFSGGEIRFLVFPAEDPEALKKPGEEYDNDLSLVTSLTYGSQRFLLTGDIERARIEQMLETDADWRHDWIKLPHHGRYKKNLDALLEAVQPSLAIISTSAEELPDLSDPKEKTLKLLNAMGIPVWSTSRGTVTTVSDGKRTQVRYE